MAGSNSEMTGIDDNVVAINEASSNANILTEGQQVLYDRLEGMFSQAGITDVGGRLGIMLQNDDQLGRFLGRNTDLTVDILAELHETLGTPTGRFEAPKLESDIVKNILTGSHSRPTGDKRK